MHISILSSPVKTFSIILLLLQSVACKKGELQRAPEIVKLTASNISLGTAVTYSVTIDGALFSNELSQVNRITKIVERKSTPQHIEVKEKETGKTVVDTMLLLPVHTGLLTILKLSTDPEAVPIVETSSGSTLGPDEKLWGFYVTDPLLPDSMSIKMVRASYDLSFMDYPAVFERVYKGKMSEFKKVDYTRKWEGYSWYIEIRDLKTGDILPGSTVDPSTGSGGLMASTDLIADHYINDIAVYDLGGGNFFYYSNTMMGF